MYKLLQTFSKFSWNNFNAIIAELLESLVLKKIENNLCATFILSVFQKQFETKNWVTSER